MKKYNENIIASNLTNFELNETYSLLNDLLQRVNIYSAIKNEFYVFYKNEIIKDIKILELEIYKRQDIK